MAEVSTASAGLKFQYVRATFGVKMPGSAFRVLMVYWSHARADLTHSHPKRVTVWQEAGISENSADAAIKWLRTHGWLTLEKKAVGTFPHRFTLTVPEGIEWEGGTPEVGGSTGAVTAEVGESRDDGTPKLGESDSPKIAVETPQKLGGHNRSLNRSLEEIIPPTPTAPVQQDLGPATAGEGDSFQEWIKLLPSSKRKNLREARAEYNETISNGVTAQDLIDGTRAYVERENSRTDDGRGGKFISQALKVLEEEKWRPPTLSTAEAIAEAQKIDRRMRELRAAGNEDGATAVFNAELGPLLEKYKLVRDEFGFGFRVKPKPFNPAAWAMY